jgi:hypothetical protein
MPESFGNGAADPTSTSGDQRHPPIKVEETSGVEDVAVIAPAVRFDGFVAHFRVHESPGPQSGPTGTKTSETAGAERGLWSITRDVSFLELCMESNPELR